MRKLIRSIARANMERAGIHHANKKRFHIDINGIAVKDPSYFAENFRKAARSKLAISAEQMKKYERNEARRAEHKRDRKERNRSEATA